MFVDDLVLFLLPPTRELSPDSDVRPFDIKQGPTHAITMSFSGGAAECFRSFGVFNFFGCVFDLDSSVGVISLVHLGTHSNINDQLTSIFIHPSKPLCTLYYTVIQWIIRKKKRGCAFSEAKG